MLKPHPARPKYSIGQKVEYRDRHGRLQIGEVKEIEAKWGRLAQKRTCQCCAADHPGGRFGVGLRA